MTSSVFKSPESRDKIRASYNAMLSRFPFEQAYLETPYGKTFILAAGKTENPPIILLHGSCTNSAFWVPELMALSENYRVYAVDIIGEAGNSHDIRPDLQSDAFAQWMKSVLSALGLEKAVIIGNSLGGWMALKFAVAYPECVSKLILLAPAGLSRQNPEFPEIAATASTNNETLTINSTVTGSVSLPKEVEDFINLILWGYNPITEELPVFAENELQKLTMPILYVAGQNDNLLDTAGSVRRLNTLLPGAEVHVLENTGHMLIGTLEYIVPFLMKGGAV